MLVCHHHFKSSSSKTLQSVWVRMWSPFGKTCQLAGKLCFETVGSEELSLLEAPVDTHYSFQTPEWIHMKACVTLTRPALVNPQTQTAGRSQFKTTAIPPDRLFQVNVCVLYLSLSVRSENRVAFWAQKKNHVSHRCASFNHKNTNRLCCSVNLARRRSVDLQRVKPLQKGSKLSNSVVAT